MLPSLRSSKRRSRKHSFKIPIRILRIVYPVEDHRDGCGPHRSIVASFETPRQLVPRSCSQLTRDSSSPTTRGYQKQSKNVDKGVALDTYNSRSAIEDRALCKPRNGNMWSIGAAKTSDESILPLHNAEEMPGIVLVTRDIRVS